MIAFALNYIPVHWAVHRDVVPDPAGDGAIRHLGGRARRVRLPQRHPVRHRQLCRAARFGQRSVDLALVVLFAVFFWTFLWGLYGSFIGVPIVIAALTFCEHIPERGGSPTCSAGRSPKRRGRLERDDFKSTRTSDLARSAEARRDHIRPDGVRKIHLASSVYLNPCRGRFGSSCARNARGHAGIPAGRPFRRFPAPALPFPVPASEQENILHVISVYLPQIVAQSYGMTVLFRRRPAQRARGFPCFA